MLSLVSYGESPNLQVALAHRENKFKTKGPRIFFCLSSGFTLPGRTEVLFLKHSINNKPRKQKPVPVANLNA